MSIARPRVAQVTVEITGYDGQIVRFTYHDTRPDQQPDASTGIELEIATEATAIEDDYDLARVLGMRYVHELRVDNSPYYTVQTLTPPTRADSERATPDALPAAPRALEAAGD